MKLRNFFRLNLLHAPAASLPGFVCRYAVWQLLSEAAPPFPRPAPYPGPVRHARPPAGPAVRPAPARPSGGGRLTSRVPRPCPLARRSVFAAEAGVGGLGLQAASALAGLAEAFLPSTPSDRAPPRSCCLPKRRPESRCTSPHARRRPSRPAIPGFGGGWGADISPRQPPGSLGLHPHREARPHCCYLFTQVAARRCAGRSARRPDGRSTAPTATSGRSATCTAASPNVSAGRDIWATRRRPWSSGWRKSTTWRIPFASRLTGPGSP